MGYTIGFYFNKNNQGPHSAYSALAGAKANILNNIRNTKRVQDVEQLSQQLNDFFYPKTSVGQAELINFNQILTDAFWGGWEQSGAKSRIGVSIETAPELKANLRKANRLEVTQLKDYRKDLVSRYEEIIQSMEQGNLTKLLDLIQSLNINMEAGLNLLIKIIDQIKGEISSRSSFGVEWKGISLEASKRFGVKGDNGKTYYSRDFLKKIVEAMDQVSNIEEKHLFTTKDVGEIFEYAVALFNVDLTEAKKMGASELQNYLNNNFKMGQIQAARNSFGISAQIDTPVHYTERNKKGEITKQIYNFGGIELEHWAILEAGDAKQSKVDVRLKDGVGASLKNWSSLDLKDYSTGGRRKRDFGTTSLLKAIARNSQALQQYIWALQTTHGTGGNNYDPTNLINSAHMFAKISIYADILMGLGFQSKDYHAGTIIINSRADKKIIIFNAAQEISKALQDTGTSRIAIEGYNQGEVQKIARSVMETVKAGTAWNRTAMYTTVMQDFLNGQKVKVVYNNFFD